MSVIVVVVVVVVAVVAVVAVAVVVVVVVGMVTCFASSVGLFFMSEITFVFDCGGSFLGILENGR